MVAMEKGPGERGQAENRSVDADRRESDPGDGVRGPHAWLNWQAQRAGLPARSSSHGTAGVVLPLWVEFGLYSDTWFTGDLAFGPYQLLLAFPARARMPSLGHAELTMVLRADDYLLNGSAEPINLVEQDVETYTGGDLGDEIASLLALASARRVRSGGIMRHGYEKDPRGMPIYADHHPQALIAPARGALLPTIAAGARFADAEPYLLGYVGVDGSHAVALLRAAHQYADALWWADADPRIAWIKLFGALEAAASAWDIDARPDPIAQLDRRHPGLSRRLKRDTPDALTVVAESLSRILGAETKLLDFVLAHAPPAPTRRPTFGQIDFDDLEQALRVLYDHRSRDLHGGIPIPDPLCRPPMLDDDRVPIEAFPALAAAAGGGSWPVDRLPMFLHTFAYIAGEALRRWWLELLPS